MNWLAGLTIWGEARGEDAPTQKAVAHVLLNRLKDGRWGTMIEGVCLWPEQFSCWNERDPNRRKMCALGPGESLVYVLANYYDVAPSERDPTFGATHYYDDSISAPNWTQGATFCCKIGRLNFYKDVA